MAEQLIDRRSTSHPTGFPAGLVETSPLMGATQGNSSDALRQAKTCLDSAGRRLRKGEPENADEALNLLLAAADHLRQAMTASVAVDARISTE